MTTVSAVSKAQPHFPAATVVIRDMDVLHAARIGRVTAAPALELRVDAAVRTANVHGLALRVKRHTPCSGDARMPDTGDRMRSRTSRLDGCKLGLKRSHKTGGITFRRTGGARGNRPRRDRFKG